MPATPQDHKKKKVTSPKTWKSKSARPVDLELPSGNVCRVRRMPLTKMLTGDIIPDSMRPIINKMMDDSATGKEAELNVSEMMKDQSKMNAMFETFDRVAVACVVEPEVKMPPEDDDDRDEDILYADEVDLEDKMHIFQFCVGGDADLSEFRKQA